MESSNVKGFGSPSAELKPNWRHRGHLGAKQLGNVVAMGIPLGKRWCINCSHWLRLHPGVAILLKGCVSWRLFQPGSFRPTWKTRLLRLSNAGMLFWNEWLHRRVYLQVWYIQAPVLGKSSWCEYSVSFLPSLYLSSEGLTPPGLSPTQTIQREKSGWNTIIRDEASSGSSGMTAKSCKTGQVTETQPIWR